VVHNHLNKLCVLTSIFYFTGNLIEVEAAICSKADLNEVVFTDHSDTYKLLHLAVLSDHLDALQRLLNTGDASVDQLTGKQVRALYSLVL
jgi:hypothetical protein